MRVGLLAGEESGDLLGGEFIKSFSQKHPRVEFFGLAGEQMITNGCEPLAHINQLSVMGLMEVVKNYPKLYRLRSCLIRKILEKKPDIVLGIDSPDFNLGVEFALRREGIKTVHYVGPQIWAWRGWRIKRLAKSIDKLLVLFPFEETYFSSHGIDCEFVGHPLADRIEIKRDKRQARQRLGLSDKSEILAILPGSRTQEISCMLKPMLEAARLLTVERPRLFVLVCLARQLSDYKIPKISIDSNVEIMTGKSEDVFTAADVALVCSGTATLEGALCGTPMVVGYKMTPLSYYMIRSMIKIQHIALPNILSEAEIVPELIQKEMTPPAMAEKAMKWLVDIRARENYKTNSRQLHQSLRQDASQRVMETIWNLAGTRE